MSQRTANALARLKTVSNETARYLDELSASAEQLSARRSGVLFGVVGASLGVGIAYALSLATPFLFAITGPILTAAGMASGILYHRGPRRLALERRIEENRLAADELMDRMNKLPRNAPKAVREELWRSYMSLTQGFYNQATYALEGRRAQPSASPPPALPRPAIEIEVVEPESHEENSS